MLLLKPRREAAKSEYRFIDPDGQGSSVVYYRGKEHLARPGAPEPEIGALHPVAFQVVQDADTALDVHFHVADQFQIFTAGDGGMGPKTIAPLFVHYTNAMTPYGPLRAGPAGITYLTLRNGWDRGPRFVKTARAELRAAARQPREEIAGPIHAAPADVGTSIQPLFGGPDDVGAWLVRAAPHAPLPLPAAGRCAGQFLLLVAGAMSLPDVPHQDPWCVFVDPGEAPPTPRAGAAGAAVLVLRFRPQPE